MNFGKSFWNEVRKRGIIAGFEIAPEYRGKGIAALLLETVCQDALTEGYAYVEAYPAKDDGLQGLAFTDPKRLYEKAGFMVTAQKVHTFLDSYNSTTIKDEKRKTK